ncbi:MAG: nitrous oxide reductase family maturation protein NosD [Methylobacteriaceae bacterium]|jgi:nitrous oxidase accessory protein|nr:nitrous oxide reductase family maturation protein NosD [Methylobacteriaceae bacterium]
MNHRQGTTVLPALLASCVVFAAHGADARAIPVSPDRNLLEVIDSASPGDVIRLKAGEYRYSLTLNKSLTLEGEPGAVIRGPGEGSVITVNAPNTVIRSLTVRGSGTRIDAFDSGVLLNESAAGSVVDGCRFEENLNGVYILGAADSLVRNNTVIGYQQGRSADAGNGISLWKAPGSRVIGNRLYYGRDGLFVQVSRKNLFRNNIMRKVRFGVHYMYAHDSELDGNISIDNVNGYAMMYSDNLVMRNNVSYHDRDQGFLFTYANRSNITGNRIIGGVLPAERWLTRGMSGHGVPAGEKRAPVAAGSVRIGPDRCVFIFNSNNNAFSGNSFEGCEIGVHFTAGSEGNYMWNNAFVSNQSQVKYVSTRYADWTRDGRGNYWSDNPAFDLDGDGIADTAYRPNDIIDRILWTTPQAKVLINSPSVQVIRWAQSQFPALHPGGVTDSRPLMMPPDMPDFIVPPDPEEPGT